MQHVFDISKLFQEAQFRWLKPSEVLFILQNHEKCLITSHPPNKPPSGSVFLFNRRVLRFFRKDGHAWRRKKDGRTIGEGHERLKVGNVDALNCYYAHGEENPYFQRRSYWMLELAYEHVVFVHYREVVEGRCNIFGSVVTVSANSSFTLNQNTSPGNYEHLGTYDLSLHSTGSLGEVNSASITKNNLLLSETFREEKLDRSSQSQAKEALKMLELQLSLDDDSGIPNEEEMDPPYPTLESMQHCPDYVKNSAADDHHGMLASVSENSHHSHYVNSDVACKEHASTCVFLQGTGDNHEKQIKQFSSDMVQQEVSPFWKELLETTFTTPTDVNTKEMPLNPVADIHQSSLRGAQASDNRPLKKDMGSYCNDIKLVPSYDEGINLGKQTGKFLKQQAAYGGNIVDKNKNAFQGPESHLKAQLSAAKMFLLGPDLSTELPMSFVDLPELEDPIPCSTLYGNCNDNSFMSSKENGLKWMDSMQLTFKDSGYSSNISDILFDQTDNVTALEADSSLTMAEKQLFSIREVSPEWAFSNESTKVIIVGDFLCNCHGFDWMVMFGEIEVSADIIQDGVLRCQVPQHVAGSVTLCLTTGNRESCSEVQEFEYRVKPQASGSECNLEKHFAAKDTEELSLLNKLVQILLSGYDPLSSTNEENYARQKDPSNKLRIEFNKSTQAFESRLVANSGKSSTLESLLQELLRDKLEHWLLSKSQENVIVGLLSKPEQSIIHMISGLGFEWALAPILSAGVGVNFRDPNGWTALHWAAHFGREKMVAALLAAGASPGVVTDPTAQDPVGKTPASIAAAEGHKGLAGYLSEVSLTSHLSLLTLEESEISKASAELQAERAVESISERNIQVQAGATEDELSLKDSLAAVRNAAQAASRIQSAFRAHSFRKKQQKTVCMCEELNMTSQEIQKLSAASKVLYGHHDMKLHTAACCIQRRYRGWKGRRNFLTLRRHVVKIQAHVRGHQAIKKYKEFLWMVNVLEKAILRWRRKGEGLRGFRVASEFSDETDENDEDILKVFRRLKVDVAVSEAVSRVMSMVESPSGRMQYRRMLESYQRARHKRQSVTDAASSNIPSESESLDACDENMLQALMDTSRFR